MSLSSTFVGGSVGPRAVEALSGLLVVLFLTACLPFERAAAQQSPVSGSGSRIAIVVANATYPDASEPLNHPIKDARKLAEALREHGFEVTRVGEDLTNAQTREALDGFYAAIKPGSAALAYFAGYGLQSGNRSYAMPVDARIWGEADIRQDGIDIQSVLQKMSARGASYTIAIIDAARTTPWDARIGPRRSPGLAPIAGGKGSIVLYAASPNAVVDDEAEGDNSLFMRELLKAFQIQGISLDEAFNRTKYAVADLSKGERIPWVSAVVTHPLHIGRSEPTPTPTATPTPSPESNAPATKIDAPARQRTVHLGPAFGSPESQQKWPANTPPARGGYLVQVGSQRTEADAQAAYQSLQAKFQDILGRHRPIIRRADLGNHGIYWRAYVGPFADAEDAGELCKSLRAAGGLCLIQRN